MDPLSIQCELCPNFGGLYVQTTKNNKWVHLSCCLWLPNITVSRNEDDGKIYADISNVSKQKNKECINCRSSIGSMVFCLICGTQCHVTCCNEAHFSLNMIPLQEYATWSVEQVCAWLKGKNLSNLCNIFERHGMDGLSLGELTENDMIEILDLSSSDSNKLQEAIREIQV